MEKNKKPIVVIFSGGTGSQALQKSIKKYFADNFDVHIIISAYDNGKSTGEVRKIFNNNILGPSDLRKNQMLQFDLYSKQTEYNRLISEFMNIRFDATDAHNAHDICYQYFLEYRSKIEKTAVTDVEKVFVNKFFSIVSLSLNTFFNTVFEHKNPNIFNFNDFSIANIIYASIAHINNDSLATAGHIMADVLGIDDKVHLISDVNLYLNAITEDGTIISDEGQIVDWNNPNNKITDIVLLDKYGIKYIPSIDEDIPESCMKCSELIEQASIIVYSSGTQWSSEIPTYIHKGLNDKIKASEAEKYFIMNNTEDKDMRGVNSAGLIKTVMKYLNMDFTTVVYNQYAEFSMRDQHDPDVDNNIYRSICGKLSNSSEDKKHNEEIFRFIVKDIFARYSYCDSDLYVFDFDDTLYPRSTDSELVNIGKENLSLLSKSKQQSFILSGNSINRFKDVCKEIDKETAKNVFSMLAINGGNSIYKYDDSMGLVQQDSLFDFLCIKENYFDIVSCIIADVTSYFDYNLSIANFENRGNSIISIKPIDQEHRSIIAERIKTILNFKYPNVFNVVESGRSTIDIMPVGFNKLHSCETILNKYYFNTNKYKITYVGDEFDGGNDAILKQSSYLKCLFVKNIYITNLFLKILTY